ncbi:MAG: hypothetical protein KatS3mg005_3392 [Bryobacteraceae bacterium]|nr:MAG: hypothetical protein KatS3mg005_3392 [Bryobacteraceae bacterium]
MEDGRKALQMAGEAIDESMMEVIQMGELSGASKMATHIAQYCTYAQAIALKRLKDSGAYRRLGLDWEQFCPAYLGRTRPVIDAIIKDLEQHGKKIFELAESAGCRVPGEVYRYMDFNDDGKLMIEGEEVDVTRANAEKIRAYVKQLKAEVRREKEAHQKSAKRLTEALEEKKALAKEGEERVQKLQEALEQERNAQYRWTKDPLHSRMLDIQTQLLLQATRLRGLLKEELNERQIDMLVGLANWAWSIYHEIWWDTMQQYAEGPNNRPYPAINLDVAEMTARKRDLLGEWYETLEKPPLEQ